MMLEKTEEADPSLDRKEKEKKYENDDDEPVDKLELLRLKIKTLLLTTFIGRTYSKTLTLLSVCSALQFIIQSYYDERNDTDQKTLYYFSQVEVFVAVAFFLDWCLMYFIADYKTEFLQSFYSMIDIATIIPTAFTYGTICPYPTELVTPHDTLVYIMNAASTMRVLRILRIQRYFSLFDDPVKKFLSEMILVLVCVLVFGSCLMMFLERPDQTDYFHNWIYYSWITVSTVGYGDITPVTKRGKFFFMALIAFAIVLVPMLTNRLLDIISQTSKYARQVYHAKSGNSHVLVCGDLRSCSLHEFFAELFHEDHENTNLTGVILQPYPPTFEMLAVLDKPEWSLIFLEGSPLTEKDLKRAAADTALAVFILANKFSNSSDQEDSSTILQQQSIIRYANMRALHNGGWVPPFCKQIIRPENKKLTVNASQLDLDLIVCINEIKMGMFAKSALFPGANTLILNLISSFSDENIESSEALRGGNSVIIDDGIEIDVLEDDGDNQMWMAEYLKGCGYEIYTSEVSEIFNGANFATLSNLLYWKMGIILFGLQITDITNEEYECRVVLNPGDYIIPDRSEFYIEGLILAENKAQSDLTTIDNELSNENSKRIQHLLDIAQVIKKIERKNAKIKQSEAIDSRVSRNAIHRKRASFSFVDLGELEARRCSEMEIEKTQINAVTEDKYKWQKYVEARHDSDEEVHLDEMARMEVNYLKENYFVRSPLSLSLATINTSVTEEIPGIKNHIVIIGKDLSNLYDLVLPLRAKLLGKLDIIVILSSEEIPYAVWQKINVFEGIIFVRGSPVREMDLRRAGVYRARKVIIMSSTTETLTHDTSSSQGANISKEALEDVDVIFSYRCVKQMNPSANTIIEMVHTSNIAYLDFATNSHMEYKFTPQFASGMLFTSSLLDTLIVQSFYNPNTIPVINKLISGMDKKTSSELIYKNKKKSKLQELTSSCLYQIAVPEDADNRTFGYMYQKLSKDTNIIPIAVYRGTLPSMKAGPQGNKMPYVVTNPHKDMELFSCDKLFVLSQLPVKSEGGKSIQESMEEIRVYEDFKRNDEVKKIQEGIKIGFQEISNASMGTKKMIDIIEEKNLAALNELHRKVKDVAEKMHGVAGNPVRQSVISALRTTIDSNKTIKLKADATLENMKVHPSLAAKMVASDNKRKIPGLTRSLGSGSNSPVRPMRNRSRSNSAHSAGSLGTVSTDGR